MRALFITTELPYPPSRNGIALINFQLLLNAPDDFCIDVLIIGRVDCDLNISKLRELAPRVNVVKFTNSSFKRKYRIGNLLSGAAFGINIFTDPVVYNYIKMCRCHYDIYYISPLMNAVDFRLTKPLFLNAIDSFSRFNQNAYYQSGKWYDKIKSYLYRKYEKNVLTYPCMTNFVSLEDLHYVVSNNQSLKLSNYSNGIDSVLFSPLSSVRIPGNILFTGNFDYNPNKDAAIYLANRLFPMIKYIYPSASLSIVGKNPPKEINLFDGVTITGFVDDIVKYYREAHVFVCALHSGSGVKNKILESLSCGLPIVSTSIGVEGIDGLVNGMHYLLAETDNDFVKKILLLFNNENLCKTLEENSRAIAIQNFSWQKTITKYYIAFRDIVTLNGTKL